MSNSSWNLRLRSRRRKMGPNDKGGQYQLLDEAFSIDDSEEDEILHEHGPLEASEEIDPLFNDDATVKLITSPNGHAFHPGSHDQESFWSITLEILFPFIVAGLGMVGAGIVLDIVQHWPVFETVNELFILVPALLGLKGNLEMTLASRLSTQVCV